METRSSVAKEFDAQEGHGTQAEARLEPIVRGRFVNALTVQELHRLTLGLASFVPKLLLDLTMQTSLSVAESICQS